MSFSSRVYEDDGYRVSISMGNKKLLCVPNISLTPWFSCAAKVPCADKCYARKAYVLYPKVRHAWNENFMCAKENPDYFFQCVENFLVQYKPKMFRVHVGGDFFSAEYVRAWYELAESFPRIRFLAFTKQYKNVIVNELMRPRNFRIIFSAWPGMTTPEGYPVAWYQNGSVSVPRKAFMCRGSCDTCKVCFTGDRDVMLKAH